MSSNCHAQAGAVLNICAAIVIVRIDERTHQHSAWLHIALHLSPDVLQTPAQSEQKMHGQLHHQSFACNCLHETLGYVHVPD